MVSEIIEHAAMRREGREHMHNGQRHFVMSLVPGLVLLFGRWLLEALLVEWGLVASQ